MDKEIINAVGTVVTIVALVMGIVIGGTFLKILASIGIVYTMLLHDEYLKVVWAKEKGNEQKTKEEE